MNFLILLLLFIVSINHAEIHENLKEIKIAMFTFCARSHLRTMTSIAQELSLNPSNKVTLVINGECEGKLRSQNYDFNIEVVHSTIDK